MKEWKVKQEIYHRLNKDFSDDLNDKDVTMSEDVVADAVRYFRETDIGWIYPSKSYMVAICYAHWLAKDYGENFIQCLKDPDLLYGNDPYYKTYDEDPETYNKLFREINFPLRMEGMVPDVRKYYEAECGL